MIEINDAARLLMAGHMGDVATKLLRGAKAEVAHAIFLLAADVLLVFDAERDYREGLARAGLAAEDIDDAIAAVLRGEHPPGSLPAMVVKIRDTAEKSVNDLPMDASAAKSALAGSVITCRSVLALLGVEP